MSAEPARGLPAPSEAGLPDAGLTFPEAFARRVARTPDQPALHVVGFTGREPTARPHTYAQLSRSVHQAAALLSRAGVVPGDAVLLCVTRPDAFFAFLVAAQVLGAVPAPLPSLADLQLQSYAARLRSVARDARPRALVVDDARARQAVTVALEGEELSLVDAAGLDAEALPLEQPLDWRCRPDGIAFLQYTSGSTGEPRGVVVRHGNLTANLRAIIEGGRMDGRDVVYSWLPVFHDMGLVAGLLLGMYLGIPAYVAPLKSFVYRPDSWLRAIHRFRATFSPAPNFAYHLLATRIPDSALRELDLSSWRLAFDGAEPIDPRTADAFIQRFAPAGFRASSFRPAYGLAEATLAVSFVPPEAPLRTDTVDRQALAAGQARPVAPGTEGGAAIISAGKPVPGHRVRILSTEDGRELPERQVGEVAVTGPSVTPGYLRELREGAAPREELRTGDLGYFAEGELFIVDRLKDLLVVGGRKHAPSDVERVVGTLEGVRTGAVVAFGVRGEEGTEEVVLAVTAEAGAVDGAALEGTVKRAVQEHFGFPPRVVLVRPGALPKTSSGKLQRSACRALYLEGKLPLRA
jgi:acyl-CoA synthetase (AMP-forming)/AMP-acid ligase II